MPMLNVLFFLINHHQGKICDIASSELCCTTEKDNNTNYVRNGYCKRVITSTAEREHVF